MEHNIDVNSVCRCCMSEGFYKDLKATYVWMGEDENYSDMLKQCFDINITSVQELGNSGICEVCITQLRNASNFKKQVLCTEEQLQKRLSNIVQDKMVKLEMVEPNDADCDTDNMDDDASNSDYLVPIKEEIKVEVMKRKRAVSASKTRAKKCKNEEPATSTKKERDEDSLICQSCQQKFTTLYNLKRHSQQIHGKKMTLTTRRLCDSCGKFFFNAKRLDRHLAVGCLRRGRDCLHCNMTFESASDTCEHMRRSHWAETRFVKIKCSQCDHNFESHIDHDVHLRRAHDIVLGYQELVFDCLDDLNTWKDNIERNENVCFIKRQSHTDPSDYYYHCYPMKYLGKPKIRGKSQTCPARIEIRETADIWLVSYQATHTCASVMGKEKVGLQCPLCDREFGRYQEFDLHLSIFHAIELEFEELAFSTYDGTDAAVGDAKTKRRRRKKNDDASATPERIEHRVNLTAILQYSNASPFRDKTKNGFSCLYCCKYFKDINDLRIHTAQQSEKDKLNLMIDYKLSYNPIKIDITDLQCTVCDMEMSDLNDLKDHLVTVHSKTIYKNIKDIILPFRLEDGTNYRCVICSVVHISFKNLYHHMSSHYRNYCCKKCGVGYITIAALRKHGKTHEDGNFPCEYCEKSYTSLAKKKQHEKGVHTGGWLRNKCPHCPEIFVSYYDRSEHLVRVHNETPITYPCNACDKVYKKKFELNRHIKHHHLQQKNFKCNLCNANFFSKRGLTDHMLRHVGGMTFSCDVCGKSFTRSRTLKEHLKVHEDGKRFQCEICKKYFMQKCTLKSHIRLHQDDLDIFKEFDDVKHLIDNRDVTLKQIAEENRIKERAEQEITELTQL